MGNEPQVRYDAATDHLIIDGERWPCELFRTMRASPLYTQGTVEKRPYSIAASVDRGASRNARGNENARAHRGIEETMS